MGKPILYGMEISPVVRSVLLVAKAIELDIGYKEINLFTGEHLTEEFLKMNPQHTLPTLDDNGQYLWESHAILSYLVHKYGKNDELYPKNDLYKRARIDQRLHFDNGILYARLGYAVNPIHDENKYSIPQHVIDQNIQAYELVEKFLEKDPYLVGDSLTIADLSCVGNLSTMVDLMPADEKRFPKLHAWLKRMKALPYYEEANGKGNREYIALLKDIMKKRSESLK